MKLTPIPNTPLSTPPIQFGGNVFGWTLDESSSFRMLDMIFERRFRFIDTSDSYGKEFGLSETIIGKWMKSRGVRNKITLATKVGRVKEILPDGSVKSSNNNTPEYMQTHLEESLLRLQTDYIDLYYTHFDDEITPLESVLKTHQKFLEAGKIRAIGASNYSRFRLQEAMETSTALSLPPYGVIQAEYNLMERKSFETEILPVAQTYGFALISYFSLAAGFLTGKYRKSADFEGSERRKMTEKYLNPRGLNIIRAVEEIAQTHQISMAAVALRWLLQRPGITACLASATKANHLDAFEEAVRTTLTNSEMERLNEVSTF